MRNITNAKYFIAFALAFVLLLFVSVTYNTSYSTNGRDAANTNKTNYGMVDWSTAVQGYITFTAANQERCFILQGPNTESQMFMTVAKNESAKIPITDGAGKYQYAISNKTIDGTSCIIQYKNSFNVSKNANIYAVSALLDS